MAPANHRQVRAAYWSLALWLASMAMPALVIAGDMLWGFRAARLAVMGMGLVGQTPGSESFINGVSCVLGTTANAAFLIGYVALWGVRLLGAKPDRFRLPLWLAVLAAAAGATSVGVLLLAELHMVLPGFFAWEAAMIMLGWGAWRASRDGEDRDRGFEVVGPRA